MYNYQSEISGEIIKSVYQTQSFNLLNHEDKTSEEIHDAESSDC